MTASAAVQGNPYVGPRPFQSSEGARFYGREREARDLLSLVVSERLVLFYAQSGAGKSSLINARLSPGLKKRGFTVLPVGRVSGRATTEQQPDNVFIFNLLTSLDEGKTDPARLARLSLADYLGDLAFEEIAPDAAETVAAKAEFQPLALLIDQFEEIFTNHLDAWNRREAFFQQIAQALEADPYLWIVLVMREDYVAEMDPYAYLLPGRLRARYYMQRMEYSAALEAVRKPVEDIRPFDEGVAEKLVDNLRLVAAGEGPDGVTRYVEGQFIEPVQLQVVCLQLWEQLKGDSDHPRITGEDLEKLSRGKDLAQFVSRALADFYEQAIAGVLKAVKETTLARDGQISERALREWFSTQLITEAGTRGFVFQGDVKTGGLPNPAVRLLEQQFIIRSETRAAGKWYELVHDRFVAPILQANQEWRDRNSSPLTLDAQRWENEGRSRARLYQGNQLRSAVEWLEGHGDEASDLERDFIDAGREAEERQRTRRQRALIAIFSVLLVVLSGLTLFSLYQTREATANAAEARSQKSTAEFLGGVADQQRATAVAARAIESEQRAIAESAREKEAQQRATAVAFSEQEAALRQAADSARLAEEAQRKTAEAAKSQAEKDRDTAVEAREQARVARNQAFSSRLASLSVYFRANKIDLSLLLAVYAQKISRSGEAMRALLDGVQLGLASVLSREGVPFIVTSAPRDVAFSPDGSLLATANIGKVNIWNIDGTGSRPVIPPAFEGDYTYFAVAFHPTEPFLLRAGGDGQVKVLNLDTGDVSTIKPFGFSYTNLYDLAFQPSGKYLAIAAGREPTVNKGQVFLYDFATREKIRTYDCDISDCITVAWSPDGSRLAIASRNGSLQVIDVARNIDVMRMDRAHADVVYGLAWYPDGQRLISGGIDSRLMLWDTGTRKLLMQTRASEKNAQVQTLAISPDGQYLLVGTGEIGVWFSLWKAETLQKLNYSTFQHSEMVSAVAFHPQGSRFATAGFDHQVVLWSLVPVDPLSTLAHAFTGGWYTGLLPQPDGSLRFLRSSQNGLIEAVDTENEPLFAQTLRNALTTTGQVGDRQAILVGGFDGVVTFLDPATGEPLRGVEPLKAGVGQLRALATSRDGKTLAAAVCHSSQNCDRLALFDLQTRQPIALQSDLEALKLGIFNVLAFSPAGNELAIGTAAGSILFYDLETGDVTPVVTEGLNLKNVTLSVTGLAYSEAEQNMLAVGFNDGRIALWDVTTLDPIGEFAERMNGQVNALSFRQSEDGFWRMVVITGKGEVREWDVDERVWVQRACRVARRNLTEDEKRKFLPADSQMEDVCTLP